MERDKSKPKKSSKNKYLGYSVNKEKQKASMPQISYFFMCSAIICLLAFGSIEGLMSAFDIPRHAFLIFVAIAAFSLICSFLSYNKLLFWVSLPVVIAGYVWYLNKFQVEILEGMEDIGTIIECRLVDYFGLEEYDLTEYLSLDYSTNITYSIIVISFIFIYILSINICWFNRKLVLVISTFPPIILCLFWGLVPSLISIVFWLSGYMIVGLSGKIRYVEKNAKYLRIVLALSFIFTFPISLILKNYVNDNQPNYFTNTSDLRKDIDDIIKDTFLDDINEEVEDYVPGNISDMLGNPPQHEKRMNLTFVPYNTDTVYIRNYIGTTYSNNSFSSYTEVCYGDYNDMYMHLTTSTLNQIESNYNNLIYQRYNSNNDNLGVMVCEDYYSAINNMNNLYGAITYNFLPGPSYNSLFPNIMRYNQSDDVFTNALYYTPLLDIDSYEKRENIFDTDDMYYQYIYTNCLEVPESIEQSIKTFIRNLDDHSLHIAQVSDYDDVNEYRLACIELLYEEFSKEFNYSFFPDTSNDEDADIIDYFLNESKEGYYSYFAASAVLILREKGIPCRYVEGYAVPYFFIESEGEITGEDPEDYFIGETEFARDNVISIDVDDSFRHAWIEVFIDGYGFYPVDITPAVRMEANVEQHDKNNSKKSSMNGFTDILFYTVLGAFGIGLILLTYNRFKYRISLIKQVKNNLYREDVLYKYNKLVSYLNYKKYINNPNALPVDIATYLAGKEELKEDSLTVSNLTDYILYSERDIDREMYDRFVQAYKNIKKKIK